MIKQKHCLSLIQEDFSNFLKQNLSNFNQCNQKKKKIFIEYSIGIDTQNSPPKK